MAKQLFTGQQHASLELCPNHSNRVSKYSIQYNFTKLVYLLEHFQKLKINMVGACHWPKTKSKPLQNGLCLTYLWNNDTKFHQNQCTLVPVNSEQKNAYNRSKLIFSGRHFVSKRCMTVSSS